MTRRTWWLTAVALVLVACIGGAVALINSPRPTSTEGKTPVATATVERGDLSEVIAASGTLTYRARPDGSPYDAINRASGTYTELPESGDAVACGDALYRVDDTAVLLLCGAVPFYRDLGIGATGTDVAQLNNNLHTLGYAKAVGVAIQPNDHTFTWKTQKALGKLQSDKGQDETGILTVADAVVMPTAIRVFRVASRLGGTAQPGTPVLRAKSDELVVQVNLDPSQRSDVPKHSSVRITLPDSTSTTGKVAQIGRVATVPEGSQSGAAQATILLTISLDDRDKARGLDQAPVRAQITTAGVEDALSVPVVALVGKSGGGYAVDVVRDDGRRELVPVTLGLFDDATGRVQVEGDLNQGDSVVVPS